MPRGYGGFQSIYGTAPQSIEKMGEDIADAIKEAHKNNMEGRGAQLLADEALAKGVISHEFYAKFTAAPLDQKAKMTGSIIHAGVFQNQQNEDLQRQRDYQMRIRNYNNLWQQQQSQQDMFNQGPGAGVKWFNGQAYRWNGSEWLPLPASLSQGGTTVQQELFDKTGLQPQAILSGITYDQPSPDAAPVFTGPTQRGFLDKKTLFFQPEGKGQAGTGSHVNVQGTTMPYSDFASYYRRLQAANLPTAGAAPQANAATGKPTPSAAQVAPGYGNPISPQDQQALAWAQSNPQDPRAAAIKQRLGIP